MKFFSEILSPFLIYALILMSLQRSWPVPGHVDKYLKLHAEQWVVEYRNRVDKDYEMPFISINFGPTDRAKSSAIGLCLPIPFFPIVLIDRDFWSFASNPEREQLLFHELGHCLLWRGHTSKTFRDGRPISIMNPVLILSDYEYMSNREYYLNELFGVESIKE